MSKNDTFTVWESTVVEPDATARHVSMYVDGVGMVFVNLNNDWTPVPKAVEAVKSGSLGDVGKWGRWLAVIKVMEQRMFEAAYASSITAQICMICKEPMSHNPYTLLLQHDWENDHADDDGYDHEPTPFTPVKPLESPPDPDRAERQAIGEAEVLPPIRWVITDTNGKQHLIIAPSETAAINLYQKMREDYSFGNWLGIEKLDDN